MILTQRIGDKKIHNVKLASGGYAFVPGEDWFLIFTVKSDPDTQEDALASIQKTSNVGIAVSGRTASIEILPIDTTGSEDPEVAALAPGTYYWDIQAQSIADPEDVRSVGDGIFELKRDVTRDNETAIDVYVASAGLTYDSQLITYT